MTWPHLSSPPPIASSHPAILHFRSTSSSPRLTSSPNSSRTTPTSTRTWPSRVSPMRRAPPSSSTWSSCSVDPVSTVTSPPVLKYSRISSFYLPRTFLTDNHGPRGSPKTDRDQRRGHFSEIFEAYLRNYLTTFAHQAIDSYQWKEHLFEYFKDKRELLDTVDFDLWFNGVGMPPTKPVYGGIWEREKQMDSGTTRRWSRLVTHCTGSG